MDWNYIKAAILANSGAIDGLLDDPNFLKSDEQVLLKTASLLHKRRYYPGCLHVIEVLERRSRGDLLVKARHLKADVYLDTDKYQDAVACYSLILGEYETDIAYSNRALAYWSLHQYKEALSDYRAALELNPDNSIAHRGAGEMCLKLGLLDEAVRYFESAIKIDPTYIDALVGLGLAFYHSRQWVKSYEIFLAVTKLDPLNDLANRGIRAIEQNFGIGEASPRSAE